MNVFAHRRVGGGRREGWGAWGVYIDVGEGHLVDADLLRGEHGGRLRGAGGGGRVAGVGHAGRDLRRHPSVSSSKALINSNTTFTVEQN